MIKKLINRIFSPWGFAPLTVAVCYNFLVYFGCSRLTVGRELHSLALPLDARIPLVSWTVLIYFGCYVFWIINYILIYRRSREYAYRFFIADFFSRTVCLAVFLAYPTTLERPVVEESEVLSKIMVFLYSADKPTNLFPSIHCLVSWFCFIGIWTDRKIPLWYKVFSFFFSLAVFVSTLTTRQHVILDVVGGVALAQLSYWIAMKTELWRFFSESFDSLNRIVASDNEEFGSRMEET